MNIIYIGLSWIFGLAFLLIGIDAFFESRIGGLSFILISLLLLPPARDFLFYLTQKEIPAWSRGLFISLLIFSFGFFMVNSKKQQTQSLEAQLAATKPPIKQHQVNTDLFKQSSPSILINTNTEIQTDLLSSTDLEQSSNTSQINQENNDKTNSEAKSAEILAKLKNIPASEYELNLSLYQQLVSYNPSVDKYKKKFNYYSEKVSQQSGLIDTKATKLACKGITKNNTFNYAPEWLSTNVHCLSSIQKKKIEKRLFAKVKKLSSKKIRQNRDGYKSLSILNPGKKTYLDKLKRYENKLKLRTAKN